MLQRARLAAWACCGVAASGQAVGSHFAVDDAAMLEAGQCQLATWLEREGSTRTLFHIGPACRIGPVELGLNADRSQWTGQEPATIVGPQIKWAAAVDDRVSIGVVALAGWQGKAPRHAAALYAPLTVRVSPSLSLHANGGRDWSDGAPATTRAGLAVEWVALRDATLIGERFRQSGGNFARLGVRWQAGAAVSIDLSRAQGLGSTSGAWWTLGVNWALDATQGLR
jgi:hypothetical protein